MNDLPNRDADIFTEAVDLPADERAAYLERACGGNAKLRQRVEALLQTHDHVGDFLEESPQKATIEARIESSTVEKPGDWIGRYKLLQQIGEGGCGVVYMAEQEAPVRRRVALKIIKLGMDTKGVIARFEAERQALALMDHPNIAKVFDAGATESGRPYFVMQLIRGDKITEYCDRNSLSTDERLKLFIQVCRAIQHAHQKGIIHRDIKPSNILVTTTVEGGALPVVIDFGIAKATTNQPLTDKTLFTAFEMLVGTPAYMSPEQAALTSADLDTRTDIYSLGVLLYELLTSATPFDVGELLKKGLDEIRRVIREQEPVRPSTRLSKMTEADLTTVAQRRKSEPPGLVRMISGDLDWIAMKAAADAALAFEHQPYNRDRYPVLAALLAKTYNRPAYEKLCKRLLANYSSTTNIFVADQVAKSCLFLPFSNADLPAISHLTDMMVTLGVGDAGAMPYFQDCKALCEYRQGHYAEAVEWAQKPLKIPGIYVHGHSYAVLAMAYWRPGEKENARAMLAKGDTLEPGIMPASIAEDPGSAWLAWLFARIQLDEATALIQPLSTPENISTKP